MRTLPPSTLDASAPSLCSHAPTNPPMFAAFEHPAGAHVRAKDLQALRQDPRGAAGDVRGGQGDAQDHRGGPAQGRRRRALHPPQAAAAAVRTRAAADGLRLGRRAGDVARHRGAVRRHRRRHHAARRLRRHGGGDVCDAGAVHLRAPHVVGDHGALHGALLERGPLAGAARRAAAGHRLLRRTSTPP